MNANIAFWKGEVDKHTIKSEESEDSNKSEEFGAKDAPTDLTSNDNDDRRNDNDDPEKKRPEAEASSAEGVAESSENSV